MLLIGDIHLTSKIKDKLLSSLKCFIDQHDNENNIVFLGDFVYHFSYDRNALLELYDLFLEIYSQGKNLYILAGNHDWLGNMFVFEEGRKAFEVLSKINEGRNEICFITKPMVKQIEGQKICFLPSMLDVDLEDYDGINELKDDKYEDDIKSKNKNLVFSAKLNLLLKWFKKKYSDLILIHHYYIEGVSFPGQKAKFSFKDRALSQERLDDKNFVIISGHLHQSFSYKNYLCTGSLWATSPLESDQIKYFWSFNGEIFEAWETGINYYLNIERKPGFVDLFSQEYKALSEGDILSHRKGVQKSSSIYLKSGDLRVEDHYSDNIDLKNVSISVMVEKLQYDSMSEYVDDNLQQSLQNIQLKKVGMSAENLLEQLDNTDMAGVVNFSGRLELLKKFLKKQYPDDYEEYEKLLQDMKIL